MAAACHFIRISVGPEVESNTDKVRQTVVVPIGLILANVAPIGLVKA